MAPPNLNLVTNLVTFLDFMTPIARGQRQVDSHYSDLLNAFDRFPHNPLLHKLRSFEFPDSYVSLFCSYLTKNKIGFDVWVVIRGSSFEEKPFVIQ
jgi:hypothetical protein